MQTISKKHNPVRVSLCVPSPLAICVFCYRSIFHKQHNNIQFQKEAHTPHPLRMAEDETASYLQTCQLTRCLRVTHDINSLHTVTKWGANITRWQGKQAENHSGFQLFSEALNCWLPLMGVKTPQDIVNRLRKLMFCFLFWGEGLGTGWQHKCLLCASQPNASPLQGPAPFSHDVMIYLLSCQVCICKKRC